MTVNLKKIKGKITVVKNNSELSNRLFELKLNPKITSR